jgi:hypothetical protein
MIQKDIAAIKADQEEMRAAITHPRYAQANSEVIRERPLQSLLIPTERNINRLGNKELRNTLSEAMKRELEIKLTEAEDRVSDEGSGNAAICVERGTPMLPGSPRLGCLSCKGTPQKDFPEEDRCKPEKRQVHMEKKESVTSRPPPHNITPAWTQICNNLKVTGRIGDQPCIVTVDTGSSVSIARPDIAAGCPHRQAIENYCLRSVSGQSIPILKEAYVELILGKRLLIIWVLVANITEEFTLGLDVLYAHKAVVDLGRHVLRLDDEEVPLRLPSPLTKGNSKVTEAGYGTDAAVRPKELSG